MKLLFLLLDSADGIWSPLYKEGAEKTWLQGLSSDDTYCRYLGSSQSHLEKSKVLRKIGNGKLNRGVWPLLEMHNYRNFLKPTVKVDGKIMKIDIRDRWSSILLKTLSALDFSLRNYDFDYVIRANATAFINLSTLREYLQKDRPEYAGPVEKNKPFASGWSIVLSRSCAEDLLSKPRISNLSFFDDEAIGKILMKKHKLKPLPFLTLKTLEEIQSYSKSDIQKFPTIRCKILKEGKRQDHLAQKQIYMKLKEE